MSPALDNNATINSLIPLQYMDPVVRLPFHFLVDSVKILGMALYSANDFHLSYTTASYLQLLFQTHYKLQLDDLKSISLVSHYVLHIDLKVV